MEGVDILESTGYGVLGLENADFKTVAGKNFEISELAASLLSESLTVFDRLQR